MENKLLMGCWKVKWGTGAGLDKTEGRGMSIWGDARSQGHNQELSSRKMPLDLWFRPDLV